MRVGERGTPFQTHFTHFLASIVPYFSFFLSTITYSTLYLLAPSLFSPLHSLPPFPNLYLLVSCPFSPLHSSTFPHFFISFPLFPFTLFHPSLCLYNLLAPSPLSPLHSLTPISLSHCPLPFFLSTLFSTLLYTFTSLPLASFSLCTLFHPSLQTYTHTHTKRVRTEE